MKCATVLLLLTQLTAWPGNGVAAQEQHVEAQLNEPVKAEVADEAQTGGGLRAWFTGGKAQSAQTDIQHVLADGSDPDDSHNNIHRPGDDAYREAVALLDTLQARPMLAHLSRPTGALGIAASWAKQLFTILFLNGPPTDAEPVPSAPMQKLSEPLAAAVRLLESTSESQHPDAIYMLAELNFHGHYGHPRNYTRAFELYQTLATLNGNSSAQHKLGFMYATGIGDVVDKDQAKALVYHTFAADGGDTQSQMTVAFRHHSGIAVPRDCDQAADYYKMVADKAIKWYRSGPPGGHHIIKENYRLADEIGGVYGQGASVSSSGMNAHPGGTNKEHNANLGDMVEYYDLQARRGDISATLALGRMHYEGSRAIKQDYRLAIHYFLEVASRYWSRDGKIKSSADNSLDRRASQAAAYIGRMFLRGEGMAQDFAKARKWFKRGVANGDPLCQFSMGLMYMQGLGVEKDALKAATYFRTAAEQDLAPAQVQMGILLLDQGDVAPAIKYFELGARHGNIEAFYYLAEMTNQGIGRDRSCPMATIYYKIVAEKAEAIHSSFHEANEAYEAGDLDTALPIYMQAAEQGYEAAQANVGYLLDQRWGNHPSVNGTTDNLWRTLLYPFWHQTATKFSDAALALIYWTRSAKQSNYDSLVKMGDYYLSGLGTPLAQPDPEKAAACYQAAAEQLVSAQAMWNLGWMHENGIGIAQDFHLAKRFYDQALETNPHEAYLPVTLALLKLRARSYWNTLVRGKINSIREEPKTRKRPSLAEWIGDFLRADLAYYENLENEHQQGLHGDDGGPDMFDEWETAYAEELDESIIETLVMMGLATALIALVYWRQQRNLEEQRRQRAEAANRQAQQNQPQQQQQPVQQPAQEERGPDGGVFPRPGDPEFNNWAVGGIGH